MEEIPEKTLQDELRGIIGFKIIPTDIQAVWKLSQNRDAESYYNVIGELEQGDVSARQVAASMLQNQAGLFGKP